MKNKNFGFGRGFAPLPRLAAMTGVLALSLAGCDEILDVTDPDIVDPSRLSGETALPSIRAGAQGDFKVAYVGTSGGEGQILTSGLLGDEWFHSGTFPTRAEIDIRRIDTNNGTLQNVTRNLYRARSAAEAAVRAFEEFGSGTVGHAEVLNLAGFTYVFFGENYCSGVPFSDLNADGTFTFGGQTTTTEVLERALERANAAIAVATQAESATQLNTARVLKGRALVNLGRYAEAAEAVAEVPTGFQYNALASENTGREQNGVHTLNAISERWSVANNEGGNGLPYRTAFTTGDPRTPWRLAGRDGKGFDRTTPQYNQLRYPSREAAVVVADGVEARLIEAEAALNANDGGRFLSLLNDLRADASLIMASRVENFSAIGGDRELSPLTDPGTREGRVDLLFQERAYWLWLTSHRLGDMRRLIRQYERPADTVFPIGEYHKNVFGGVYGDDVNLPISVDERNNPEFSQFPSGADLCLNRDA